MTELKFEQLVPLYATVGKTRREAVEGNGEKEQVSRNDFHMLTYERLYNINFYLFINIYINLKNQINFYF